MLRRQPGQDIREIPSPIPSLGHSRRPAFFDDIDLTGLVIGDSPSIRASKGLTQKRSITSEEHRDTGLSKLSVSPLFLPTAGLTGVAARISRQTGI